MQFLIDHLIAIIVGSVLLGALLVLQQRGQQSAIAATQQYRSQAMAGGFATTLERDVENMRSRAETERAFAIVSGGGSVGTDRYRFRLRLADDGAGGVYTKQFSFPTLADARLYGESEVIIVTYHAVPTGETARIDGADRPLYRVTRSEFARGDTRARAREVFERIVDFDVTAFSGTGDEITTNSGADMASAESPARVHVEIVSAPDLVTWRANDQQQPVVSSTRHARTIRVAAASARAGDGPVDLGQPGGIPLLPGDDGAEVGPPPEADPAPEPEPDPEPEPGPEPGPGPEPLPGCRLFPFLPWCR